jgi:RNA polymerase sigma factor (sigma-70 family)
MQDLGDKAEPGNGARRQSNGAGETLRADLELAEKSAAGDREAFEELYRRNLRRVYGLCLHLTGDVPAAEILTQDTFVKAWTAIGGYSGRGDLGAWLGRIAVNLRRDEFRALARREKLHERVLSDPELERVQPDGVIPLLTALDLKRALTGLPEGARTVFVLYEMEGYSHKEIAGLLGVAVGTVKAQLHRARQLLRRLLTAEKGMGHDQGPE